MKPNLQMRFAAMLASFATTFALFQWIAWIALPGLDAAQLAQGLAAAAGGAPS